MFNKIKNFLVILVVLVVVAIAAWNVNFNSPTRNFSDTMLANVEALAEENESGDTSLWKRTDSDCVYTIEGAVGSTVTIFGVTIKIGAQGKAVYTYGDGSTDCRSGGDQQCEARYCPHLF